MVSTMAIPQIATLPTFPGPPVTGPHHTPMHGTYYGGPPVLLQQQIIPAGQVVGGNTTEPQVQAQPFNAVRVPMVPVGGGCYNDGMQVVWHGEFSRLFSSFFPPCPWFLSITESRPMGKWRCHSDSAKVRFCCQDCGNGWTSMKGRVTFWYLFNERMNAGFVQFKLYGQVCKKCNCGRFEFVMWYPEEVAKVMFNLYNKVGQAYYGFHQTQIRVDRRPGRPRNQHNADLCQACRDGECDQGRPAKALVSYLQTSINDRFGTTQIVPFVNQQVPVVLGQPPMGHPGSVLAQGVTPSSADYMTAPVTLSSSVQPILTYSVGTADAKEFPELSPLKEQIEEVAKEAPGLPNCHCTDVEDVVRQPVEDGSNTNKSATEDKKPATDASKPSIPDKTSSEVPLSRPSAAIEIKPPPDSTPDKAKSPSLDKQNTVPKASPTKATPVITTAPLLKPKTNGVSFTNHKENDIKKPLEATKMIKEIRTPDVKINGIEKPVMNGYATAARKVPSKPVVVNGNA